MSGAPRGDLLAVFASIADLSEQMGRRHNLPAMRAGLTFGILAGARSLLGIAQWIHDRESNFWHQIGFLRSPPCANCFRSLLLMLPADILESVISSWVVGLIEDRTDDPDDASLQVIVIDGKTLRAAMQQHRKSIYLRCFGSRHGVSSDATSNAARNQCAKAGDGIAQRCGSQRKSNHQRRAVLPTRSVPGDCGGWRRLSICSQRQPIGLEVGNRC